jgi:hypothetical protein
MDADVSTIEFLSVGDLIGQAVRLCWRNISMILQVLLVPAIGCMIGRICMQWPLTLFGPYSNLLAKSYFKSDIPNIPLLWIAVVCALIGMVLWFYSVWIMMLRLFALVKLYLAQDIPEEERTFAKVYKKTKSLQWAILAVFSLGTFVSVLVTFGWTLMIILTALIVRLHIIPAWILASLIFAEVLGMLLTVILISIIYWLAYNDIILEEDNVKLAIARAWLLAWPNFWRIIFFVCLIVLVTVLITWPLSLPLIAFSIIEMFVKGGQASSGQDFVTHISEEMASFGAKAPFYRLALAQGWETMISIVTWPINLFAWAFFYQDLKKRTLSLDLLAKLQDLKTEAEAGGGKLGEGVY